MYFVDSQYVNLFSREDYIGGRKGILAISISPANNTMYFFFIHFSKGG